MTDVLLGDFFTVDGNDLVADLELLVAVDEAGQNLQCSIGSVEFVSKHRNMSTGAFSSAS